MEIVKIVKIKIKTNSSIDHDLNLTDIRHMLSSKAHYKIEITDIAIEEIYPDDEESIKPFLSINDSMTVLNECIAGLKYLLDDCPNAEVGKLIFDQLKFLLEFQKGHLACMFLIKVEVP